MLDVKVIPTSPGESSVRFRLFHSRGVLVVGRGVLSRPVRAFADRGDIKSFSERSAIRLRRYLRDSECEYPYFLTLTYPGGYGEDGVVAKRDLRCFLQRLKWFQVHHGWRPGEAVGADGSPWSVQWVLEFQSRGAVHFHLNLSHPAPKEWVSRCWYEIVGSEDPRHLRAGTRIESWRSGRSGLCSYMRKYLSKMDQKELPEGFGWVGRFWGVWGVRRVVSADIDVCLGVTGQKTVNRAVESLIALLKRKISEGKVTALPETRANWVAYVWPGACFDPEISSAVEKLRFKIIRYSNYHRRMSLFEIESMREAREDMQDEAIWY